MPKAQVKEKGMAFLAKRLWVEVLSMEISSLLNERVEQNEKVDDCMPFFLLCIMICIGRNSQNYLFIAPFP